MTNQLVAIGFLGDMKVYVNLTEEEACARFTKEELSEGETIPGLGYTVRVIPFGDSFYVYDVWADTDHSSGS